MKNTPRTIQICSVCDKPTGFSEEDAVWMEDCWTDDGEPICEECAKKGEKNELAEKEVTERGDV